MFNIKHSQGSQIMYRKKEQQQGSSDISLIWLLIPFVVLKILLILEPQITRFLSWLTNFVIAGP